MKLLRFGALVLLLIPAVVCLAQESPKRDADHASVRLAELYKVKGRAWSHRVTRWERGADPSVTTSTVSGRITEVNADSAMVMWNESSGNSRTNWNDEHEFDAEAEAFRHWAAPDLPEEVVDLGFSKFPCRRHVKLADGLETTTWVSTEYHPLIVKQTVLGKDSCEVRRLTSFDATEIDPWALYRVHGRSWTVRNSVTVGGGKPMVSYLRQSVTQVSETQATMKYESLDEDMKPMAGAGTEMVIKFAQPKIKREVLGQSGIGMTRETCEVKAGEFVCHVSEIGGGKTWTSVAWPGLTVRMEMQAVTCELIEFDLGHDEQRFYGAVGNKWVLQRTTIVRGEETQRGTLLSAEITAIADGVATVQWINFDGKGNEVKRSESQHKVEAKEGPCLAYTGQAEEVVPTPAGKYFCWIQESDEIGKVWWHHGVLVKQVHGAEGGILHVDELIEFKMQ